MSVAAASAVVLVRSAGGTLVPDWVLRADAGLARRAAANAAGAMAAERARRRRWQHDAAVALESSLPRPRGGG